MTDLASYLFPEDLEWLRGHGYEERGGMVVRLPELGGGVALVVPLDDDDREMFESVKWLPHVEPLALVALSMRAGDHSRLFRDAHEGTAKLTKWSKPAVERLIKAAYHVNSMVRPDV